MEDIFLVAASVLTQLHDAAVASEESPTEALQSAFPHTPILTPLQFVDGCLKLDVLLNAEKLRAVLEALSEQAVFHTDESISVTGSCSI